MITFDTYSSTLLRSPLRSERDTEGVKSPIKQKARKLQTRKSDRSALEWSKDLELIKTNKSEAAFARLFYHFAPRVKAFLIKSGADVGLAEECAQEVMVTVWNKAHLFDPSRASASTWIFTIARNKKIDALRKQLRPTPDDLGWGPEHEPDQEEMVGLQQETEKLGQAIAKLPDKQRVLVKRAYYEEMSHNEIAEATGLPLGTIKSRIRLALERLRHAMN
ncbi:MAG: sigma-70 family RNA polymerase sigma factor [Paracoccaceae bacterium]|nr:sigma-70 family RNA polymerase sigma factor [Paracoccaceae bacterium]